MLKSVRNAVYLDTWNAVWHSGISTIYLLPQFNLFTNGMPEILNAYSGVKMAVTDEIGQIRH